MIWSFSTHRQFIKCQRQWFYKNLYASATTKDPMRKEAYYLSQLKSISAWRGDIVDKTIGNFVVRKTNFRDTINLSDAINYARHLCRRQIDFATAKTYRNGDPKTVAGDAFCALYSIEYGIPISNVELKSAWNDIEAAITNFFHNEGLMGQLRTADKLVAQRPLLFSVNGVSVRGVPDLIAFYKEEPPHIFDWKVHFKGTKAYDQQLAIYALALARCSPHKDFPIGAAYSAERIKVTEYQLLMDVLRDYEMGSGKDLETEEFIAESILEMGLSGANNKLMETKADDFETTRFPETCATCSFKKICWEQKQ